MYNPNIYRLQLPTLAQDLTIPLGSWGIYPYLPSDLAVLPGQPQSFVIALAANNSDAGTFVYDNSIARQNFLPPNPAQAFEEPHWLIPAATPGTYITQSFGQSFPQVNTFDQLTLDASGISRASSTPLGYQLFYPKPLRVGARLFTSDGTILDAASGSVIGAVPGLSSSYAMVADEVHGRLFVWTAVGQQNMVVSYDLATLTPLAYAPVYAGSGSTSNYNGKGMVLWGSDGVALVDNVGGLTLLSGSFFTTYRGQPTM